jgi:hypothetical protein
LNDRRKGLIDGRHERNPFMEFRVVERDRVWIDGGGFEEVHDVIVNRNKFILLTTGNYNALIKWSDTIAKIIVC